MSPLRQRMKEDLAIRGLAPSTQQAYLKAVERLARRYGKRPDRLSSRDVQRFLLHLHEVEGLSWGTCNTFVNGLRFFYHITLGRTETAFRIPCPAARLCHSTFSKRAMTRTPSNASWAIPAFARRCTISTSPPASVGYDLAAGSAR